VPGVVVLDEVAGLAFLAEWRKLPGLTGVTSGFKFHRAPINPGIPFVIGFDFDKELPESDRFFAADWDGRVW